MTRIRVNPGSLNQSANEIRSIAQQVRNVGNGLWQSANSIHGYNGQLERNFRPFGQGALSQAQKRESISAVLSQSLFGRASAFSAADAGSSQNLKSLYAQTVFCSPLKLLLLASILGMTIYQLQRLIRFGGLFIPGLNLPDWIFSSGKTNQTKVYGPFPVDSESETGTNEANPDISTSDQKSIISALGIASLVPITGAANPYPRLGYSGNGSPESNCTWYAAEAVKTFSNGKINLPNWGNATNWANGANSYLEKNPDGIVKSIDQTPQPGDIVQFNYGHVAFVESVETRSDGKTYITWSEENATGSQAWPSGSEQIDVNGEPILRWNQTHVFNDAFVNRYNPQFIHLNY